ncbi:TetR/AcrR family transcriptional regulator [Oceanobacillus piezotolerans]|uniref:TetR/AcrR family transcriptional regulator n=1 Tax=Oceanobacillus piezotolerans TaxID=2448030 RepID=A0A498DFC1_9BACI|nr:TetR family transcriptional regulator [Oceanobacillus piezotolerans]RLL42708.1 TetR/AcrR family transcriptional regulator [Oceanobacillus piezotolerans]
MPKQTFFNLPEHKRNTLIEAAGKEFSRVPLAEASISNIIKEAHIPRGSFYQYFENKEDLYLYLLKEEAKGRNSLFISMLKKHNGDIILAMTAVYRDFLEKMPDDQERDFFKNALLNVTHKLENVFMTIFEGNNSESMNQISQLINTEKLNIKDDKEIHHIIQIITAVAFRNFVEKFSKELSDETAIEHFVIEMNLLKQGLYKRE